MTAVYHFLGNCPLTMSTQDPTAVIMETRVDEFGALLKSIVNLFAVQVE